MNGACVSGNGPGILYGWLWPCSIKLTNHRSPLSLSCMPTVIEVKLPTLENGRERAFTNVLSLPWGHYGGHLNVLFYGYWSIVIIHVVTVSSALSTSFCKVCREIIFRSVIYIIFLMGHEFGSGRERRNAQINQPIFSKNNSVKHLHRPCGLH